MKNEAILKSLNIIKNGDMSELDFLIDAISKEIKEAELKKSNGADYAKLSKKAKKILEKNEEDSLKTATMEEINGKEMQIFFDNGYYCVALYKPLDIPMGETDNFKSIGVSLFEKTPNNSYEETAYDIGEIKLALVNAKDKKHGYVEVGNSQYNPQYFLNIVEFLGGSENTKFYQGEYNTSTAYFESEFGKALLCPVRHIQK